ncbi:MAG: prephenate dehydratase [Thermodesulfovibrionales bacterium]|nr:prephenate dehydratase [Thermodesulfovibrionales bacterium]
MKDKNDLMKLKDLRDKIDIIDEKIVDLLSKRAEVVTEIAKIKKDSNLPFHNPEREREIIERVTNLCKGNFPKDALKVIFREIISASLSLEEPLKVAYLGPEGTFTHLAAIRHFGSSAKYIPVERIKAIFDAVEAKKADYGLVPIENSNEGVVSYTLDVFVDCDLKIAAEVLLEVSHNLLSKDGDIKKIKRIYSHPQASAQCREWLERNVPNIPVLDAVSTAKAAEIASSDETSAAIASELAARLYDLKFIEKRIEDNKNNFTRFLAISRDYPKKTGKDKTSIMFSLKDKPGALFNVLAPFKKANINLTKIESRPSKRRAWEYIFFADMIGHIQDKKLQRVIEEVKDNCLYLKLLGSYPIGDKMER